MTKKEASSEVTRIEDIIYAEKVVDKDSRTVGVSESVFPKTLPESLSMDTVALVDDHRANYVAASVRVVGRVASELISGKDDVEPVRGKFDAGKNVNLAVKIIPRKEFVNNFAKEGESKNVTNYGVVSVDLETLGGRFSSELKIAKNDIADIIAKKMQG